MDLGEKRTKIQKTKKIFFSVKNEQNLVFVPFLFPYHIFDKTEKYKNL
jgi:hypothetical protein